MWDESELQHSGRARPEDILAEIDAIGSSPQPEGVKAANAFKDRPELLVKLVATRDELKADAYANGRTARGWRKTDAHRAANPEDHARNRRGQRQQKIFDETGRVPRLNRKNPTPEQRAVDLATNSKNYRKRMTQADRDAANWNRAERRRKAKAAAKAKIEAEARAEQEAMESLPTFGIA